MKRIIISLSLLAVAVPCYAHEHSIAHYHISRAVAVALAASTAESTKATKDRQYCELTVDVFDAKSGKSLPGIIRLTNQESGKHIVLKDLIKRDANWFTMSPKAKFMAPQAKISIEAMYGLETETGRTTVDLTGKKQHRIRIGLKRFYDARHRGQTSGNTHLHLMRLTHGEAVRYLQQVPKSDDLDLLFVSVLRRIPDERHYITNKFTAADLKRIAPKGVLLGNGEEHRHNFKGYGEGYGHVMLLNLVKLIRPISIGPGIMRKGFFDGTPLARGIQTARKDGATVIWCHNTYGMEDIPNFAQGRVHAQNIFDGSATGNYAESFYRYLNIGMKVPFSTGTDWFIFDFSRVYCPTTKVTINGWLNTLRDGRSFITNGPFLEFQVNGREIGDTIQLAAASQLKIRAKAFGRANFSAIEVVHNGKVIQRLKATKKGDHYEARLEHSRRISEPGWLALRIPLVNNKNAFGKRIFAHTSPIYVRVQGKSIFRKQIAEAMIQEMNKAKLVITEKGKFRTPAGRQSVLKVYDQGIEAMRKRIKSLSR